MKEYLIDSKVSEGLNRLKNQKGERQFFQAKQAVPNTRERKKYLEIFSSIQESLKFKKPKRAQRGIEKNQSSSTINPILQKYSLD